jgi:hypothetical protein
VIGSSSPIEPMVSVNDIEPANLAVSSQNGVRITTDAGAAFSSQSSFKVRLATQASEAIPISSSTATAVYSGATRRQRR